MPRHVTPGSPSQFCAVTLTWTGCCAVKLRSAVSRALPLTPTQAQVTGQCNDPGLQQCGLEKCVAADGCVEWVAAHSKARLEPQGLGLVLGLGLGLGLGEALRPTARRA